MSFIGFSALTKQRDEIFYYCIVISNILWDSKESFKSAFSNWAVIWEETFQQLISSLLVAKKSFKKCFCRPEAPLFLHFNLALPPFFLEPAMLTICHSFNFLIRLSRISMLNSFYETLRDKRGGRRGRGRQGGGVGSAHNLASVTF